MHKRPGPCGHIGVKLCPECKGRGEIYINSKEAPMRRDFHYIKHPAIEDLKLTPNMVKTLKKMVDEKDHRLSGHEKQIARALVKRRLIEVKDRNRSLFVISDSGSYVVDLIKEEKIDVS